MIKKDEQGRYVVSKFMDKTNTDLVGIGDTREDAKIKLKEEIKRYREGLKNALPTVLKPTGEHFRSPGMEVQKLPDGTLTLKMNHNRRIPVKARPDLADWIANGRKDEER